ncbi:hypothetical protein [Brevundimonas olei]|uniref:hypothetical protein n=1 Tax=Brevundimonas olei TaxID=657642 RepID=UPI0031CE578C
MTDDIERMLTRPLPGDDDARLADLEGGVWRRIEERQAQRSAGQVRLAVMAVALLVGVTNGGVLGQAFKPRPSDIHVFSVSAGLSPMTSFEVGG